MSAETDLPRPIAREDIRVGDRIRAEWTERDVEWTETATVASIASSGDHRVADGSVIGPGFYSVFAATYTLLDRPSPALPTEYGSVVLASRLYGMDYDPPVALALLPADARDDSPWRSLDPRPTYNWYSPHQIESWTLARIVPADQIEKEGETSE